MLTTKKLMEGVIGIPLPSPSAKHGWKRGYSKLGLDLEKQICAEYMATEAYASDLAKKYKVSDVTIARIIRRRGGVIREINSKIKQETYETN
jgi:hypothetical protein